MRNAYWKNWDNKNAVEYYSTHRHSVNDLYDSEKYFLPEILEPGIKILDVGCGLGGFYNIIKSYQPDFSYTGVDVSREMIKKAKLLYPNALFEVSKGDTLEHPDENFDLVICLGTLHMTFNWRLIINEIWRVTKKHFLFDLRLLQDVQSIEDIAVSYQNIAFGNEDNKKLIVPYIILNVRDAVRSIKSLYPKPKTLKSFGYFHKVSPSVISPYKNVCMTTFYLSKNNARYFEWNVPLSFKS